MNDFTFQNTTKVYFGKNQLQHLHEEVLHYGDKVLFVYGGSSIKRSGLYDRVMDELKTNNITVYELGGVEPNPRHTTVNKGAAICKEQGALTGKYETAHPLPAGSQRGNTYNPILPQLEKLIAAMRNIGKKHDANVSQVAMAWTIAKGTRPIIGVTKPEHVRDAAKVKDIVLTDDEMKQLEELAYAANADTRGSWENPMI